MLYPERQLRQEQKNVVGIFCKRFDSFEITHFEAMKYQWLRSSKNAEHENVSHKQADQICWMGKSLECCDFC